MDAGTIRDILKIKGHTVYSVTPEKSVRDAIMLMAQVDVGALLVMDGVRVVGIFSERDYARKVILKGRASKDTKVEEIMTSPIPVTPDHTVMQALEIMTNSRVRHLPVLENDRVIGLISTGDLVKKIIVEQQSHIQHLQNYITGTYLG